MRAAHVMSALTAAMVALAGCGSSASTSAGTPSHTPSPADRPSSPAVLHIVSPTNGEAITGSTVHVVVSLSGAQVVAATSTHITPTEGHVHLYLDQQLIYMQYKLEQDVPVTPGTYALKAEFVAADHYPFSPRVWSQQLVFTVRAA